MKLETSKLKGMMRNEKGKERGKPGLGGLRTTSSAILERAVRRDAELVVLVPLAPWMPCR